MKDKVFILLSFLLLYSCTTTTPRYNQLMQNYQMVDRIIKNPDSLFFMMDDTNYICYNKYRLNYSYHQPANFKKENDEIIKKIKDNDFKDGYTYYYDDLRYSMRKSYLEHWIWIRCDKTGKKLIFYFNNKDGTWKIETLRTHVQIGIDYGIEIID